MWEAYVWGAHTFYVQSSRDDIIMKKACQTFLTIYDIMNVGFSSYFAILDYSKDHKVCRNS